MERLAQIPKPPSDPPPAPERKPNGEPAEEPEERPPVPPPGPPYEIPPEPPPALACLAVRNAAGSIEVYQPCIMTRSRSRRLTSRSRPWMAPGTYGMRNAPGHHARQRPSVPAAPFVERSQGRFFRPRFGQLLCTRAPFFMASENSDFSAIRRSSDAEAGLDGGEAHAVTRTTAAGGPPVRVPVSGALTPSRGRIAL